MRRSLSVSASTSAVFPPRRATGHSTRRQSVEVVLEQPGTRRLPVYIQSLWLRLNPIERAEVTQSAP